MRCPFAVPTSATVCCATVRPAIAVSVSLKNTIAELATNGLDPFSLIVSRQRSLFLKVFSFCGQESGRNGGVAVEGSGGG